MSPSNYVPKRSKVDFTCFTSLGRAFVETVRSVTEAEKEVRPQLQDGEMVIGILKSDCITAPNPGVPFTVSAYRGNHMPMPAGAEKKGQED